MIPLDIFFDPICPYSYLGKARLDRALEQRPKHPFVISWHPFLLNMSMPPEGMDFQEYMTSKFHGADLAAKNISEVSALFEAELPHAQYDCTGHIPNTVDAHRVAYWAGLEGLQTRMVSALFRAHFSDGRDISDPEVLADLASSIGMDRATTYRLLASTADQEAILERDTHAREKGIKAVPVFIVANQHAVEGAQPTELWLNVIDGLAGQQ